MPEKETLRRSAKDRREGKAPSTQAGEFVREEVRHVRQGKHGARSAKQAIAIGLSKARRAGVKLGAPKRGSARVKKQAARDSQRGAHPRRQVSSRRSRASAQALKKEPRSAASHRALSTQAHRAGSRRSATERSAAARKGARTRKRRPKPGRWSAQVNETSDAMTLEPHVFAQRDPQEIAASVKRSSDRSQRRRSPPLRSAMSMLNFYINRAGRQLPEQRRACLEAAKDELRALFGRPRRRPGKSGAART